MASPRSRHFRVDGLCFWKHPTESWLLSKVLSAEDGDLRLQPCDEDGEVARDVEGGECQSCDEWSVEPLVEGSLEEVRDLLHMPYLHESVLLHHIRKRYWADRVYTNIGPIVLALNPYNFKIPHYMDDRMPAYIEEGQGALHGGSQQMPHSWCTAHDAYWSMRTDGKPQSVLISGESGAGKTEAAKIVAHYLAKCSTHCAHAEAREEAVRITSKVEASSPLLEAFGNAKTVRNDNSSRFGKFMKIQFDRDGMLVGARTQHYLLERSRIVTHAPNERSFHAYYQLVAGASDQERERYRLHDRKKVGWIYRGYEPDPTELEEDATNYAEVRRSMDVVGISAEEQQGVYDILAGILHLQTVEFHAEAAEESGHGHETAALSEENSETVRFVCSLWGIDHAAFEKELLSSTSVVRSETYVKKLRPQQAAGVRDGVTKSLYEHLFTWLINRLNALLDAEEKMAPSQWVGLLDIFGFENFARNSLEQLCINLANEQLQNHYNRCVFRRDLEEYKAEGIGTASIDPPDNTPTLQLIVGSKEKGAAGIIDLLNDSCKTQQSNDDQLLHQLDDAFAPQGKKAKHSQYVKSRIANHCFTVKHYAADVEYCIDGFREKNVDHLKEDIATILRKSSSDLIRGLVPEPPPDDGKGKRKTGGAVVATVAAGFKQSLAQLIDVIDLTTPHWIRCVKPHSAKKARMFNGREVMDQLLCAGVLETVKIRKSGYAIRLAHEDFRKRYKLVAAYPGTHAEAAAELLRHMGFEHEQAQIGRSKVFLKDQAYRTMENARAEAQTKHAVVVQQWMRAKQSCHLRYYRLMLYRAKVVQAAVRAKQAMALRARMDLLRLARNVQGAARSAVAQRDRWRRDVLRKAAVIAAHCRARTAAADVRRREYERYLRWKRAAAVIEGAALSASAVRAMQRRRLLYRLRCMQGAARSRVAVRAAMERTARHRLCMSEVVTAAARASVAVRSAAGPAVVQRMQELRAEIRGQVQERRAAERRRMAEEALGADEASVRAAVGAEETAERSALESEAAAAAGAFAIPAPAPAPATSARSTLPPPPGNAAGATRPSPPQPGTPAAPARPGGHADPAAVPVESGAPGGDSDTYFAPLESPRHAPDAHEITQLRAELAAAAQRCAELQARAADLEAQRDAERRHREKAEEQLSQITLEVESMPNAGPLQRSGTTLELAADQASPEQLNRMIQEKNEAVKRTRRLADKFEQEALQLEKRRQLAVPIKDAAFDELVREQVRFLKKKKKKGMAPGGTPARDGRDAGSGASVGLDASMMNFTVGELIEALLESHRAGALPERLTTPVVDFVGGIGREMPPSEVCIIPCMNKEQTMSIVTPALWLLRDCTIMEQNLAEWRKPVLSTNKDDILREARLLGADEKTEQNATAVSAGCGKVLEELGNARRRAAECVTLLESSPARYKQLQEMMRAIREGESKFRSQLSQHRAGRNELVAEGRNVQSAFDTFKTSMTERQKDSEENLDKLAAQIQQKREHVAALTKELERAKAALREDEISQLQSSRQIAFYNEIITAVEADIKRHMQGNENKQRALQHAALLHVRQLKFHEYFEAALQEHVGSVRPEIEGAVLGQCHRQFEICWAEWELLKRLQKQDMAFMRRLEAQLVQDKVQLGSMDDEPQRRGVGALLDRLPGHTPHDRQDKLRRRVQVTRDHLCSTLRELLLLRQLMHQVCDAMTSAPWQNIKEQHRQRFPADLDSFSVAAAGLEWPPDEYYQMYFTGGCTPRWAADFEDAESDGASVITSSTCLR
eukprot:TRINITY_DN563_c4_g1_i1.p1 TRINITY_DN563_c4_g1~~TRINITY_DN563_c4_g1_i1.p1  ORF type:complete len:1765 (+),score=590.00 TRINITY_DN563_c4_g1_i1:119-5413(+)